MVIAGVLLVVPSLWLARRRASSFSESSNCKLLVTKSGLFFFSLFIPLSLFALGGKTLWPHLSPLFRLFSFVCVILMSILVEKLLKKNGLPLFKRADHERNS